MNKKILVGLCALFMLPSIQGNTNTDNSYKENATPDCHLVCQEHIMIPK